MRMTNPPFSQQRPGERLFETVAERIAVGDALYERLQRDDPELRRAVERLEFEDGTRDMGITLEEWKRRAHRRSERLSKVRAEIRAAGLI